MKTEVTKHLQN